MFNESRCKIQFHYPLCFFKKTRFGDVEQQDMGIGKTHTSAHPNGTRMMMMTMMMMMLVVVVAVVVMVVVVVEWW